MFTARSGLTAEKPDTHISVSITMYMMQFSRIHPITLAEQLTIML